MIQTATFKQFFLKPGQDYKTTPTPQNAKEILVDMGKPKSNRQLYERLSDLSCLKNEVHFIDPEPILKEENNEQNDIS